MKYPVLINSQIFRGINESEIETLITTANCKFRTYRAGSVIALNNDEIKSLIIILSGEVRGEMIDIAGRVIKIEDLRPPMALAAAFIFGPGSRFPVNVVANTDTEMLVIEKGDFLTLMQKDKRVLSNYLNVVCSKAVFLSDRLRFLSFHTIKGKLAHYLLGLPVNNESKVIIDKTQQQLSEYFGVTRPSLARALAGMEAEKLIFAKNREVIILNRPALVELTKE
jgi:CRP/FNR family transcriptional regulator, dissimilatory nitrate respiration regulator